MQKLNGILTCSRAPAALSNALRSLRAFLRRPRIDSLLVSFSSLGGDCAQGSGMQDLVQELRPRFRRVLRARPAATRDESREVYIVGLGLLAPGQ